MRARARVENANGGGLVRDRRSGIAPVAVLHDLSGDHTSIGFLAQSFPGPSHFRWMRRRLFVWTSTGVCYCVVRPLQAGHRFLPFGGSTSFGSERSLEVR